MLLVFTVGPAAAATAQLHTVKRGRQLLVHCWASVGTAMLVSWVLALPYLPVMVRHWLYTLASATFLTGVFDILGAVAYLGLGITAAPAFDRPWLCDSFQDFWARRWNLTTTYMMRVLVYEPVIEGRLLPATCRRRAKPSKAEAAAAAAATPLVVGAAPGGRTTLQSQQGCLAPAGDSAVAISGPSESECANGVVPSGKTVVPEPGTRHAAEVGTGLRQRQRTAVPVTDTALLAHDQAIDEGGGKERTVACGASQPPASAARKGSAEGAAAGTGGGGGGGGDSGASRPPVSKMRRFWGLQAVFLFSGLWHILIFWYNTHVFSWRWCAFFAIQAPPHGTVVRIARSDMGVCTTPIFMANFLLIVVARPLFFGPTDTTGFAMRNLAVGQAPLWALADLSRRALARF
ncbi:hypothetical protein VOLCADRAFT_91024 [Volvox carteri f. nagariensis]|uniref:Wax synthase domain-containing protein n=1 Tax=Volvox carteri f. nagariensis TaxID=3068 RepID=D8TVZ5_VOLCA|nr:uncharacterized protein VOLCADRAFT_91024 [Volvox carteri f. nagariensis]EFJ48280.1 hypothetical protein VOLCADRAFT_91024 [Volvox carteri f. nagariensis]|eukprot:XP_002950534.1 hypothetical protein VOLCADRAFT_91024 [Volvox carteri f. nagariensis]